MTDEYKEMERAERRAKKILKENHYYVQKVPCCATCERSFKEQEESRFCLEAEQKDWRFGIVDDLGFCSKYKMKGYKYVR